MKKNLKNEMIPLICFSIMGIIFLIAIGILLISNKGIVIQNPTYDKQLSEIYENKEEYLGKSIEMQGYYQIIQNGDEEYHFIVQYIPFFNYTEEAADTKTGFYELDVRGLEIYSETGEYPIENEWYVVNGILEEFIDEKNGEEYIRINVKSVDHINRPNDILDQIYKFDPGETIDIEIQPAPEAPDPLSEEGFLSSEEDVSTHNH